VTVETTAAVEAETEAVASAAGVDVSQLTPEELVEFEKLEAQQAEMAAMEAALLEERHELEAKLAELEDMEKAKWAMLATMEAELRRLEADEQQQMDADHLAADTMTQTDNPLLRHAAEGNEEEDLEAQEAALRAMLAQMEAELQRLGVEKQLGEEEADRMQVAAEAEAEREAAQAEGDEEEDLEAQEAALRAMLAKMEAELHRLEAEEQAAEARLAGEQEAVARFAASAPQPPQRSAAAAAASAAHAAAAAIPRAQLPPEVAEKLAMLERMEEELRRLEAEEELRHATGQPAVPAHASEVRTGGRSPRLFSSAREACRRRHPIRISS
jgi:hypothetical protein